MLIQAQGVSSCKSQTYLCRTPDNKLRYSLSRPQEEPKAEVCFNAFDLPVNKLCQNIESVMDSCDPSSPGFFYYVKVHNAAPNPDLKVAGLGQLRSPVSEEDVQALTSIATPVNRQHHQSSVQTDVSNLGCWEVGADKLSLNNPLWDQWIEESEISICRNLCPESLGGGQYEHDDEDVADMSMGDESPEMVLRCLRMWTPCANPKPSIWSSSRTHAFATVTINLPSEYAGGRTTLSSFTTTRAIDTSSDSGQSTSIIAWQNDVLFKTESITSGIRLALVYDVILPRYCPRPILTDNTVIMNDLSNVLQNWAMGPHNDVPPHDFAAYLLPNYYSDEVLLNEGEMALNGVDRQTLSIFQDAAARAGFVMTLTNVTCTETGSTYPKSDSEGYSDEGPVMEEVVYTDTYIGPRLMYPDGHCLVEFPLHEVKKPGTIIQADYEDILRALRPTDQEFEGDEMTGVLHLNYRRTAVVMFPADKKDEIAWYLGGIPHALKQIQAEDHNPTNADRFWATRILQKIGGYYGPERSEGPLKLADCALCWRDLEIWKGLTELTRTCTFQSLGTQRMIRAWKTFGFPNICNSFQTILMRSSDVTNISDKLDLLYTLAQDASDGEKDEICTWCGTMTKALLSCPWALDLNVVPVVIKVLQTTPIDWFKHYALPKIRKDPDAFEFTTTLIEVLRDNQQDIVQKQIEISQNPIFANRDPTTSGQHTRSPVHAAVYSHEVDGLLEGCLRSAASQWDTPEPKYPREEHKPWERPPRLPLDIPPKIRHLSVQRILKLVEVAFRIGIKYEEICRHVLDNVLKIPGSSGVKFIELYIPLLAPLRELLQRQQQFVLSPPFAAFFKSLIEIYLSDILGKKAEARNQYLRRVGCGCGDCRVLDKFMLDPSTEEDIYSMPKARRLHFEHMLSFSPDLCTFETVVGHPCYKIRVVKLTDIVLASSWDGRLDEAKEFLRKVGMDEQVSRIMGDRYQDVKDALEGIRPFVSGFREDFVI